jgi:hypothetical protein
VVFTDYPNICGRRWRRFIFQATKQFAALSDRFGSGLRPQYAIQDVAKRPAMFVRTGEKPRAFRRISYGPVWRVVLNTEESHREVAAQVRRMLAAALWNSGGVPEEASDLPLIERARKLQNYFAQPFFVAEPYTHPPGTHVISEALRTCRDILEARHDDIPENAFYFAGGIEEIRNRTGRISNADIELSRYRGHSRDEYRAAL